MAEGRAEEMYQNSRFITIRGLSIHYRIVRPIGPVRHRVFLLASPGQSTFNWRYIVPELTGTGCLCVLCDMPGYGLSECRDDAPQDHDTRAQYLWGLLDALDMEEDGHLNCWHLMAHGSAAGTIAQMALMQPDSAASLLMLAPVLYSPVPSVIRKMARRPGFTRLIRLFLRRYVLSAKRFARITAYIYGAPLPEKALSQLHRPAAALIGHEEMLRQLLITGYELDMSRLNDLFMPAMILWGGRDPLLGGTIPARLRAKDFSTAEYHVLSSAGHCPGETNSRAVRDFLRGWIRELWAGGQ